MVCTHSVEHRGIRATEHKSKGLTRDWSLPATECKAFNRPVEAFQRLAETAQKPFGAGLPEGGFL